ncbi:response regulator transcription factor [Aliivibrio sp. S3MY1]|uniref:response regulator transcription factor n=1 Tax=unclassified Aliivibrio TaxID=2645654 RepID=UPI002379A1F6|nr:MULTISPECIES: response regulator transcription factor [unclassified Aliivibrio]MDD9196804.1 response regulator transcription factor [Aliivibrio sp. S3MY1]MDD9200170.1 response regulator transcription factor [Aliivibrio sp. S2MY1]
MSRILVVDDDIALCNLLQEVLQDEGYDVDCVHCGESALEFIQTHSVDLVLLDVMLPKLDGYQVARRICQRFATPILMLTALGDEESMLDGLQAGADHFLAKPFNVPELLVRITAILRRVGLERQRQNYVGATEGLAEQFLRLPLTETESELLQYLIKNADVVVSKSDLQINILKKELCPFDRNLDMHISNIRRKLLQSGLSKQHIKTVRGRGYSFIKTVNS